MEGDPETVKTFVYDVTRHGVNCKVAYDVGIPLPDHQSPDELFGHLVLQQKVLVPFHQGTSRSGIRITLLLMTNADLEVRRAFHDFCAKETQAFYDDRAEEAVKAALEREHFLDLDGIDTSALFISVRI